MITFVVTRAILIIVFSLMGVLLLQVGIRRLTVRDPQLLFSFACLFGFGAIGSIPLGNAIAPFMWVGCGVFLTLFFFVVAKGK